MSPRVNKKEGEGHFRLREMRAKTEDRIKCSGKGGFEQGIAGQGEVGGARFKAGQK